MKLKLNRTLRAALIAATSAVGTFSLSTGAITAVGALLLIGQQVKAAISTESVEGGTRVYTGTWSKTYGTVSENAISNTPVDATLLISKNDKLEVKYTQADTLSAKGGDIVVGNNTALFLQTWNSSVAINLSNDIFLGASTQSEASTWGALRIGSDSAATNITGTVTLVEDSSIGANPTGGQDVNFSGTVTESGAHTLTLKRGQKFHFNNMSVTKLDVNGNDGNNGVYADFTGTVQLGELAFSNANSTVTIKGDNGALTVGKLNGTGGSLSITNGSDLNITIGNGESATFAGTLTTGGKVVKSGAGSQTLSGTVNLAGGVEVQEGPLTIDATTTVGATITNNGALTLAGTVNVQTVDMSGYEVAEEGQIQYSGSDEYAGSGYLTKDTTKYYLVRSTSSGTLANTATINGVETHEEKDNNITFTRTAAGSSGTYYINGNLAYNGTVMGEATALYIAQRASLTATTDVGGLLAKSVGTGTFVVGETATLDASPYSTAFAGTLKVATSKTLTISNGTGQNMNLGTIGAVELDSGATLQFNKAYATLNDVSVASGTATIKFLDTKTEGQEALRLTGTTRIDSGKTLSIQSVWKATMTIEKLAGEGKLQITGDGNNEGRAYTINGSDGKFGTIELNGFKSSNANRRATLTFAGDTTLATLKTEDSDMQHGSDIIVKSGVTVSADNFNNGWGLENLQVDGILNVAGIMQYSSGAGNQNIKGSGLINVGGLKVGNVGGYVFDGSSGLTVNIGSEGIANAGTSHGYSTTLKDGVTLGAIADWTSSETLVLNGSAIINTQNPETAEGHNVMLSGSITGSGALVKNGAGTLILSGNNTYTGDTVVNGGTLDIRGSIASSKVKVAEDATITGNTSNIAMSIAAETTATIKGEDGFTPKDSGITFSSDDNTVTIENTGNAEITYGIGEENATVTADELIAYTEGQASIEVKNQVVVSAVTNMGAAALTLSRIDTEKLAEVYAGADITLQNVDADPVLLSAMAIAQGATVAAYTEGLASNEGTITIQDTLTAGGGTLLANLTMADGSTLDVKGGNTMALTLGSQFTIANGALVNLDGDTLAAIAGLENIGDKVILIKQYGDHELTTNLADGDWARAHFDLSSITDADYKMYVQDGQIGLVKSSMVPEPTTGTLSLLALMALAARRRRH